MKASRAADRHGGRFLRGFIHLCNGCYVAGTPGTKNSPRRDRALLVATLLWVAGLPTYWIAARQATASVPLLKADRLAYLAVASLLALRLAPRTRWVKLRAVDLAVAMYLALALTSWLCTVPGKDLVEIKQDADFLLTCFFMPCTAYFAARSVGWTPQRISTCLWIMVAGVGTCLIVIGLAQATVDWGFLVVEPSTDPMDRSRGTFTNAVPYAAVVAILLMPAVFLYLHATRRWTRWTLIALAVAFVQCVVTSKTRVVWIAAPVALGLVGLRVPRLRVLTAILATGLAAQVLLAPVLGVDPWGLRDRMTETAPIYDRVAVSLTAANMIWHRPLFGFGLGINTFQREKPSYRGSWGGLSARWGEYPGHPHNEFLNVTVLMGIVGLAAYLALLGTSWSALSAVSVQQPDTSPRASQLAVVAQAALLILVITGQAHDVMYMSYPQVLVLFLLGMAITTPATSVLGGDE